VGNLIGHVNNRNAKILLLSEFFDDIAWWVKFMNMFNGTVKCLDLKPITCLQTDACLQGGAGYYEGDFFYVNWDIDLPQFKNYHINIKETLTIVLSVIRW
jgi:hypothetical protein